MRVESGHIRGTSFSKLPKILGAAIIILLLITPVMAQDKKPNIIVSWGGDIGQNNIKTYTHDLMVYQTPNIDCLAEEGTMFTNDYAENSYNNCWIEHTWALVPIQGKVGECIATFKKYPPRAKAGSFTVDQVMETLQKGQGG